MAHSYYDPKEKALKNAYQDMLNEEHEEGKGNLTTFLEDIELTEASAKLINSIGAKTNQLKNLKSLIEQDIEKAHNHNTNKNLVEALFKLNEAINSLNKAEQNCKVL